MIYRHMFCPKSSPEKYLIFFNDAEQLFSGIKIKFEEIVRCSFVPGKISM